MSKNLSVFDFKNHSVRVISDDPINPLFVAYDVAEALGYKNKRQAIADHCKGVVKHDPLSTKGGKQKVRVIDEPDLYRLIFGSKLKSAEQFQDWVFEDVLPAIRKTGQYTQPDRSRFITEEQAGHIYQVVMSLCRNSGLTYQKVFGELKHHFGVNSYKNILKADYPAACRLLGVQPKLSMVAHNKAVRELSDYAMTHLEANAVWRGVAVRRWGELELLANQLEKLAKKINHLKANLHDPILEQNFHFMNFDNEEIRRRVDFFIEMQDSYRS